MPCAVPGITCISPCAPATDVAPPSKRLSWRMIAASSRGSRFCRAGFGADQVGVRRRDRPAAGARPAHPASGLPDSATTCSAPAATAGCAPASRKASASAARAHGSSAWRRRTRSHWFASASQGRQPPSASSVCPRRQSASTATRSGVSANVPAPAHARSQAASAAVSAAASSGDWLAGSVRRAAPPLRAPSALRPRPLPRPRRAGRRSSPARLHGRPARHGGRP